MLHNSKDVTITLLKKREEKSGKVTPNNSYLKIQQPAIRKTSNLSGPTTLVPKTDNIVTHDLHKPKSKSRIDSTKI
jgi:hypothetical protein